MNSSHTSAGAVAAVLVSPDPLDHRVFQAYFDSRRWRLFHAWSAEQGREVIAQSASALVIVDEHLPDGDWRDLLSGEGGDSRQFLLLADYVDERLWKSAGRRPPFDVVARPLTPHKVSRAVALARLDWQLKTHLGWELKWQHLPSGVRRAETADWHPGTLRKQAS